MKSTICNSTSSQASPRFSEMPKRKTGTLNNIAGLCLFLVLVNFHRLHKLHLETDVGVNGAWRHDQFRALSEPSQAEKKYPSRMLSETKDSFVPRTQIPCQLLRVNDETSVGFNALDNNVTKEASRFHASPLESWTCHQEDTDDYFLATIDFQIQECPPNYGASALQLQASTSKSRVMGYVGERYLIKNECGFYNASVSVMDYDYEKNGTVKIELFWTSGFRHYSNHIEDIADAHKIKQESLTEDKIKDLFSDERMKYLQRHLDRIPNFPLQLQMQVARASFNNDPLLLPDCGTIPLDDWTPAGVFDGPVNDTSHLAPPNEAPRWPFRSARCQFHSRTLSQYNELLAGLRIKYLGDRYVNGEKLEPIPDLSRVFRVSQVFFFIL